MDKKQIAESFSRLVLAVDELRHAVLDEIPDRPKPAGVIARPWQRVNYCGGTFHGIVITRAGWKVFALYDIEPDRMPVLIVENGRVVLRKPLQTECLDSKTRQPIIGYEDD